MLKLFAVLLGGRVKGCNIELHDVVFVIDKNIESSYPKLVNKWFGKSPDRLHIDSSVELKQIDGYEVSIVNEPCDNENSLFFINMGGYKKDYFGELHAMSFFVAKTQEEAATRAKLSLLSENDILQQHCDDKTNIADLIADDIIKINKVENYYIQLKKLTKPGNEIFIHSEYRKLNFPEILRAAELLK